MWMQAFHENSVLNVIVSKLVGLYYTYLMCSHSQEILSVRLNVIDMRLLN